MNAKEEAISEVEDEDEECEPRRALDVASSPHDRERLTKDGTRVRTSVRLDQMEQRLARMEASISDIHAMLSALTAPAEAHHRRVHPHGKIQTLVSKALLGSPRPQHSPHKMSLTRTNTFASSDGDGDGDGDSPTLPSEVADDATKDSPSSMITKATDTEGTASSSPAQSPRTFVSRFKLRAVVRRATSARHFQPVIETATHPPTTQDDTLHEDPAEHAPSQEAKDDNKTPELPPTAAHQRHQSRIQSITNAVGPFLRSFSVVPAQREITRHFSVSTAGNDNHRETLAHFMRWGRKLLGSRADPTVTPQELQEARTFDIQMHPWTIRHDSVNRTHWDSLVMTTILIDIVLTPLSLSFDYSPDFLSVFNIIATVIFALDFCVNILSSYTTSRGVLVSGPSHTARHYLFGPWALPDFLSWFPFEYMVNRKNGRFLGIAKVIRLVKVSQLARRLHSAKKAGMFRFIRLIGTVVLVSHGCTCFWGWVAVDWQAQEDGWSNMTLAARYATVWALVIGCLNASPPPMKSISEQLTVAAIMLIGNVIQASVFGSVAVLLSSIDEEEAAYNNKLISTYERCKFLDIPERLARRIQTYFEHMYRETKTVNADADSFINELSPALICEVKFQLYRDMLKQIPFFSARRIDSCVIELLVLHLRTVVYMQDDVVIRKGETGDWMGFIGSKGSVGVLDPNSTMRKIIRILRKGDYFGEMALLQRAKRSTTAIALAWVQIHVLCRADLDDVQEHYPEQAAFLEKEIIKYMNAKVTYK
ncbi:TPA: hypothetical protein N0F65_001161 [Lagenidium giganteum]|uniref:Cyclic nucleotide-binding domain-containing protein n=1 Tax=Lagenidium giganteum TaxID=4803 RepID=A0AAV2YWD3_9STRA|nr:TPA: hypothetical protein N0F65_001161 [Lagenidium giganteum]